MRLIAAGLHLGWVLLCVAFAWSQIADHHATVAGTLASIGAAVVLALLPAAISRIDPP